MPSETMDFAWVVEKPTPQGPVYFTGRNHPALQWSKAGDHMAAIRYARKEDAEIAARIVHGEHRVCEHGWENPAPPTPGDEGGKVPTKQTREAYREFWSKFATKDEATAVTRVFSLLDSLDTLESSHALLQARCKELEKERDGAKGDAVVWKEMAEERTKERDASAAELSRCHKAGKLIMDAVNPCFNEFVHEAVIRVVKERDALAAEPKKGV